MTCFLLVFIKVSLSLFSQVPERGIATAANPSPELMHKRWNAEWITCPGISLKDFAVLHFRKSFDLDKKPGSFIINVSGDTRYRLFVNGNTVCFGPSKGDKYHWYFETIDIASFLKPGKNTLAAVVWNFGEWNPVAMISSKTGFILQGNSRAEEFVNTGDSWKVSPDNSLALTTEYWNYAGCGEKVDGEKYAWGWQSSDYDDSAWMKPRLLSHGFPYGFNDEYDWILMPRDIPLMEEKLLRMQEIDRFSGVNLRDGFLRGSSPMTITSGSKASFLIDQKELTTAYPFVETSGGKGSLIKLTYCEALYNDSGKGNRNEKDGRFARGHFDEFYPDGGRNRIFSTLWQRTYRYVQVEVETKDDPLIINDIYGIFSAYPFVEKGSFDSDDPSLKEIWNVGWRTARLCAHETYYDCPYYEQLQYAGDTRIQALISLYVAGDDRLMKKAVRMFDWSRSNEGITASRYPGNRDQYIPPFSLYWINMVNDYRMHRDDPGFVRECLPGIKSVLEWYAAKIDPTTGMLGPVPHWNYVDWAWNGNDDYASGGVPPGGFTGGSSILSLQFAYTLGDAIDILKEFDEPALAAKYSALRNSICKSTYRECWDEKRMLMADDRSHKSFSQHASIMAILAGAVPESFQADLFERINSDKSLTQATFYYRFYLFRAIKKAGLADRYLSMLGPWKDMIAIGLTTFAETPEPTRSDCHAWSASPLYDFLATVCGVEPASPGFKTVKIEPHPGDLNKLRGVVPHPDGNIVVELNIKAANLKGTITLPGRLSGSFYWKGVRLELKPGINSIEL